MTILRVGLCPELTAPIVEKLRASGVRTVLEYLSSERETLAERTGLAYGDVIRLRRSLQAIYAPKLRTGVELYEQLLETTAIFTTGSGNVDEAIGGGVYTGRITEIVGAGNSGKTQLCHSLAANLVVASHFGALYVDALSCFSPERLRQIVSCRVAGDVKTETVLSKVRHVAVCDLLEMVQVVDQVRDSLCSAGKKDETFLSNVKMILVDSLTAAASPVLTGNQYVGGLSLLSHLCNALQYLAARFRIAVVITNDFVAGEGVVMKPALGRYWEDVPSVSLELNLLGDLFDCGETRELRVVKSPDASALGRVVRFRIVPKGITTVVANS
ncbi:DNA repair protein RAD51 homolog 4-like [Dermacentor andersoni]|uniref:DNA repair protein RAD51 homolog 4-like n=1 Tax=Dermacentor andersoni TaxID=34620 RepID=UPI0021552F8B|nr:DNA repair protein RAD51 homolog 4-like [Dermacentor andersoni]